MLRQIAITAISALALSAGAAMANEGPEIPDVAFSFEGPFGTYDEHQLQRGLQVYTEVCAACHGMKFVAIGSLADKGGPHLPEDQVRAYAKAFPINDEAANPQLFDSVKGEYRPLEPSDKFPAVMSAGAPDLSVMAKARAAFHGPYGLGINQIVKGIGGAEYITAILDGFKPAPDCAPKDFPGNYNEAFGPGGYPDSCKIYEEVTVDKVNADGSVTQVTEKKEVGRSVPGSWIAMPAPLSDGQVTFADGAPNDVAHMSQDVAAFLMWAAEPKLDFRKQIGFLGVLFLGLLATLLYLTNKRLWAGVKGKKSA